MGCINQRDPHDALIQTEELTLQLILCTVAEIKSGYFCLDEGEYISKSQIKLGFENMHNALSASLAKQDKVVSTLDKFTLPFKEEGTEKFFYKDILIAYFMNSKSNTSEKATGVAQLLFRDKEELTQEDIVFIFKKIFKIVMSYSYSVIGKYTEKEKNFEKQRTPEQEAKTPENEASLMLLTGQNLALMIGQSLVEKDKKLTITEFAEKCKTFIPDRYYRDILVPKELRTIVHNEYNNLGGVDRVEDEKKQKEKEDQEKKAKEDKDKKDKEEQDKKIKEEQDKKAKEEQDKKDKEAQEKKAKEEADNKPK